MAGDNREHQDATWVAPLKNTTTMICQWSANVDSTSNNTDLATVFGQLGSGDYLDIANEGTVDMWVAFGAASGTIDETARGSGVTQCWPIPAKTQIPGIPFESNYFVHYKTASGTTVIRIKRSSLPPGTKPSEIFKAP